MNELINKEVTAIDLFQGKELDSVLATIKNHVSGVIPDLKSDKGRKEIASLAAKVAKSKTYMDDLGKTYVAELKALPKQIDAERKRMRGYLDALKDDVRKPLTEWEDAEKERKDNILARINAMNLPPEHEFTTAAEFKEFLGTVAKIKIDDSFSEFVGWAEETKEKSCLMIEGLIARKEKEESEATEIARKEKAAQEKAQAEREEKIRKEAAEAAEKKAEQDKVAAAEKAENEKNAAILAERKRSEKVEAERVAKEKSELEAAEKKAANKAHRKKINNSILSDLSTFMDDEKAKELIVKIVNGKIKHLSINY